MKKLIITFLVGTMVTSCTENYSTGERVGMITQFSETGLIFSTYEGQLNMTQTGTNSSGEPFDFSLDRKDKKGINKTVRPIIERALSEGLKVKLVYHEVKGRNWFSHRGETNHFVDDVIILDDPKIITKDTLYNFKNPNNVSYE